MEEGESENKKASRQQAARDEGNGWAGGFVPILSLMLVKTSTPPAGAG